MNASPAADSDPGAVASALLDQVCGFAEDLRRAGVPVALSGVMEACDAVAAIDLGSRDEVRTALRCTLLTRADDKALFEALFEARFRPRGPPTPAEHANPADQAEGAENLGSLRHRIVSALANADADELKSLAQEAARQHGGFETASGSDRYHLQRALRALDHGGLVPDAVRLRRDGPRRDELTERLDRSEITAAFDRFFVALTAATGQQGHERRETAGQEDADAEPLPARVEDLDIAEASVTELALLRQAVRPLAQRLAARMARRHRRPQGALDMRRTIRRSLSAGGVPLYPSFRHRTPRKPDVWLLCDVSGSVAEFARFTIAVLTAMHDEVPKLRSFLFVDDIVEVTELLAGRKHDIDPFALLAGAGAPLGGRQSDWGTALARFHEQHQTDLTSRTTVLVTGDARTHDHDPRHDVVTQLARHTRGVWLLNPEPPSAWTTGDSAVAGYQDAGAHVLEVRTLNQLAAAIDHILQPDWQR